MTKTSAIREIMRYAMLWKLAPEDLKKLIEIVKSINEL